MRILILTSQFPPFFGGVSHYIYNLCMEMAKANINIFILTYPLASTDVQGKFKVIPVIKNWSLWGIPKIIRETRNVRPNVVNLQYVPYMYSKYGVPLYLVIIIIIFRFSGLRVVTTFHELGIKFRLNKPKYWGIYFIQRLTGFILALFSNEIIVNVEFLKRSLSLFRSKIFVVPVGSNIIPHKVKSQELEKIKAQISSKSQKVISTFGGGDIWQRTDLIIRATQKINFNSRYKIKLLLLGNMGSPQSQKYRNLISLINGLSMKESVFISGRLESDEIYKFLKVSDLFIVIDENDFGGVGGRNGSLAAGFAAGLPVIGNRGVLTDGIFKHGGNIFLLETINTEEIIKGIESVFENDQLRKRLIAGGNQLYSTCLCWDQIAQRYLNILLISWN